MTFTEPEAFEKYVGEELENKKTNFFSQRVNNGIPAGIIPTSPMLPIELAAKMLEAPILSAIAPSGIKAGTVAALIKFGFRADPQAENKKVEAPGPTPKSGLTK